MLLSSLAAMATTPAGHGGGHMSEFNLQKRVSQTDVSRLNLTHFQDLTSDTEKERLASKGITVNHLIDAPQTPDGRILPANSPVREGEETYTLTVNLKYDKEEVWKLDGTAYPNYARGFWFFNEYTEAQQPDKIEFIVPSGSYDIEVVMSTMNFDFILLTTNEVEVSSDCEISLDAADASVEIIWDGLMPDGTLPCIDIPVYNPETFEVVEEIPGNVITVYNNLFMFNKKHYIGGFQSLIPSVFFVGDEKFVIGQANIKTNPNNNYKFFFEKEAIGVDGGYVIPLMADALASQVVTNNVNDYITLKPEFAYTPHTPAPRIYDDGEVRIEYEFNRERAFYLNYASVIDGKMNGVGGMTFSGGEDDIKKYLHVCQDIKIKDEYYVMPIPTLIEDWDDNYSMIGLPVSINSGLQTVCSINNTNTFSDYLNIPDDRNIYMSEVINPWLSFDETKTHVWNYGCPALVFSTYASIWANTFDFTYIGRLGERREVDLLTAEARVSVNDASPSEEILEGLQWGELPSEGKFDFEFVDTNVAVDDIPGKNVTRVGFDMARADWQPPTLQLVRFVDTEDNFTDRYAKGDDGVIEFYGGDFIFNQNPETYIGWFTEEPATEVKVEYAPYGTGSFLPLEVENIAERDFMPGFGSYYRGSLASVDRKSENGWFDVRITLTDAAGNFQEQTLSPAFKIEESVGVEIVSSQNITVTVEDKIIKIGGCNNPVVDMYSPDGLLIKNVNSDNVDVSDLTHGIYIVNITDGSSHVVRKIRI